MLIALEPLSELLLPAAIDLDRIALGGLWNANAYQQEWDRASSDLLGIWPLHPLQGADPQPNLFGVGCAWAILDESHIVLLAVHPEVRQRGLGTTLLLGLLEAARQRGANYATLEVKASNQAAIALYTTLGFNVAGRRQNYYREVGSDTAEDALILWRSGLQYPNFETLLTQKWQTIQHRWAPWTWQLISPFWSSTGLK